MNINVQKNLSVKDVLKVFCDKKRNLSLKI